MDAMVTARVPVEVKRQAEEVLRAQGSTLSEAVNAALLYVIDTGQLPREERHATTTSSDRTLSPTQRDELSALIGRSTVQAPASFWEELGERTYKDLVAEGRLASYEALS